MAKCLECSKEVSDCAYKCPSCGEKIEDSIVKDVVIALILSLTFVGVIIYLILDKC